MRIPRYVMESKEGRGPQLTTIPFDQLTIADLVVDTVYKGGKVSGKA